MLPPALHLESLHHRLTLVGLGKVLTCRRIIDLLRLDAETHLVSLNGQFKEPPGGLLVGHNRAARDGFQPSCLGCVGRQAACISTELSTPRLPRSLLNVPFQSPIRALMLLQAARSARSPLSGEFDTRFSSNSRPLGP